jgi:hypothetical protein
MRRTRSATRRALSCNDASNASNLGSLPANQMFDKTNIAPRISHSIVPDCHPSIVIHQILHLSLNHFTYARLHRARSKRTQPLAAIESKSHCLRIRSIRIASRV